ncbi:hypothetical protein CYMTET_55456 [Cymbomonas tetramitiformis]|uniref:Uncharacterized protein n=1 Tax=Cymbomonas tetramitiformis TaxID=36881 RepID=A0AAE0BCX3_9CHLO|nr:hypothetical protein CYMTET_55456 [Cymbomonas tetramitiformis]
MGTIGKQKIEYLATLEDQGVGTKHYVALLEILAKKRYYVNYYENFAWAQEVELTGEEEAEELAEEEEVFTFL